MAAITEEYLQGLRRGLESDFAAAVRRPPVRDRLMEWTFTREAPRRQQGKSDIVAVPAHPETARWASDVSSPVPDSWPTWVMALRAVGVPREWIRGEARRRNRLAMEQRRERRRIN